MLKITGIRAKDYDMTDKGGKKGTTYYVTAKTDEGIGDFNAIVYKLNENALADTLFFNKLDDPNKIINKYVSDDETAKKTNKFKQIMYLHLYESDKK